MNKKIMMAMLLCFVVPFVVPVSLQSYQAISFTTHCWNNGAGSGSGGFYQCDKNGCSWVENEDPLGEADQECDQPESISKAYILINEY